MFPSVRCIIESPDRNQGTLMHQTSFSFQWVPWKCYKTVCVVLLWFKRWNVYHKIVSYIVQINILENKETREIIVYTVFCFFFGFVKWKKNKQ